MNYVLPPYALGQVAPKPKPKKAHPELDIQKAIQQTFKLKYGVVLCHYDAGGARMRGDGRPVNTGIPAGHPDLMGFLPPSGRGVACEVKAPGNRPTELQERFLSLLEAKGVITFWADSVQMAVAKFEMLRKGAA